jgi:hypothetical protein
LLSLPSFAFAVFVLCDRPNFVYCQLWANHSPKHLSYTLMIRSLTRKSIELRANRSLDCLSYTVVIRSLLTGTLLSVFVPKLRAFQVSLVFWLEFRLILIKSIPWFPCSHSGKEEVPWIRK